MKNLPLGSYRVVDLGSAWAGPMAAQLLADLGAEVIKVESRARLDGMRLGRPIVSEDAAEGDRGLWLELQPLFHGLNRNKLSVTLNLKTTRGVGLLRDLIGQSDIVMNNYSPGVLERMGLGYGKLSIARPDVILVSMPSVGETGPLRDVLAYAPIIQSLAGLTSVIGYRDDAPLVGELQSPWSDAVASVHAALAVLAALRHRNRTGQGQAIEVAQLEATTSMLGEPLLEYQMTGSVAEPQGNFDREFAPHGNYPCLEEDTWVAIAVRTQEEWSNFCQALAKPEWAKSGKYEDKPSRLANSHELDLHVADWTRKHTTNEAASLLQEHHIAAMPVMNIEGQFLDPHLRERQAFADIEHPHVGIEWLYGSPWLLSETPGSVRTPAPLLGQNNDYVLGQLLGLTSSELAQLQTEQVVY